jgi:hypothetical protein
MRRVEQVRGGRQAEGRRAENGDEPEAERASECPPGSGKLVPSACPSTGDRHLAEAVAHGTWRTACASRLLDHIVMVPCDQVLREWNDLEN